MKNIKLFMIGFLGLSIQGCIHHKVEPFSIKRIKNKDQIFVADQSFRCQNSILGRAHKFVVNRGDLFKVSEVPDNLSVRLNGINEQVDKKAILLRFDKTFAGGDTGFLVQPNGDFFYDRKDQLGIIYLNVFTFSYKCNWKTGRSPFKPISEEKFNTLQTK